ncbi:MAG: peptide chain release factor N(5)-glutamine methyltransferase [Phycisphaeraceae bacterium]|nr:peptide chain release factor N(5)-glutamine methyltransferase [Phycisphaeraceae bacterium]
MAPPSSAETSWTTRRLLNWTRDYFERQGLDQARLAAEILLAHVLETDRIQLYTEPDRPASELERAAYRELVERAVNDEPVDYLVGESPFFSMKFRVTPEVLIPRPSTETVVEHIVQHARRTPGFRSPLVADIGTGSGAIAVAVAKHVPGSQVIATDVSEAALEIARENAAAHGVDDVIDFRLGPLLEPIANEPVNYLASNPPYISDAEWEEVPPNVRDHEPAAALRAGWDGLEILRPLITHAAEHLQRSGQIVFEFAASQKDAVLELAGEADGLTHEHVLADHEGLPRVLVAESVTA